MVYLLLRATKPWTGFDDVCRSWRGVCRVCSVDVFRSWHDVCFLGLKVGEAQGV